MAKSTDKKTVAKRAEALSEEVLESLRDRQQSVIEAMRKFVDRLDDAMPSLVDPAVRQEGRRRHRRLLRAARHDDERGGGQDVAQRDRDGAGEHRKKGGYSWHRKKGSYSWHRKKGSYSWHHKKSGYSTAPPPAVPLRGLAGAGTWDHRPYRAPGSERILMAEPFMIRFASTLGARLWRRALRRRPWRNER